MQQRDVDAAAFERLDLLGIAHLAQGDVELRIGRAQALQRTRQHLVDGMRDKADGEPARASGAHGADALGGRVAVGEAGPQVIDDGEAGLGERGPAARAREEPGAEFAFQPVQRLRQRRLREAEVLRRTREAAGLGDGHDTTHLPGFHAAF
jgi:hypothetical protein